MSVLVGINRERDKSMNNNITTITKTSNKPRLLTLKQAAGLIEGLTEYRVRMLCVAGDIKYHKFGTKYMISERVLLDFFDESG